MERLYEAREALVDLGAASVETKGPVGLIKDEQAGRNSTGLTDE